MMFIASWPYIQCWRIPVHWALGPSSERKIPGIRHLCWTVRECLSSFSPSWPPETPSRPRWIAGRGIGDKGEGGARKEFPLSLGWGSYLHLPPPPRCFDPWDAVTVLCSVRLVTHPLRCWHPVFDLFFTHPFQYGIPKDFCHRRKFYPEIWTRFGTLPLLCSGQLVTRQRPMGGGQGGPQSPRFGFSCEVLRPHPDLATCSNPAGHATRVSVMFSIIVVRTKGVCPGMCRGIERIPHSPNPP